MKSIKSKILLSVSLLIVIAFTLTTLLVITTVSRGTIATLEQTMTETAKISAKYVYEYLETYNTAAKETGVIARLSNPEISVEDKQTILDGKIQQYGFLSGNVVDAQGNGIVSQASVGDQNFFKEAMKGNAVTSEVMQDAALNNAVIAVAAPLWDKGVYNSTIVGAVYFLVDATILSDIVKGIKVGETGNAYILDKDGYTIASNIDEAVANRKNTINDSKSDPSLADLAAIEQKMIAGNNGFGVAEYAGGKLLFAYAPIGLNDWSIGIVASQDEFMISTYYTTLIILILAGISVAVGILVAFVLAQSISKPVKEIELAAISMAKGDLSVTIKHKSKDELGILAENMRKSMKTLKTYIDDIDYAMGEFANNSFFINEPVMPFVGDYKNIETSIRKFIVEMSKTISKISTAANQVTNNSEQVSLSAQHLAQGSTQQANSVEELSTSITEISTQVKENAQKAELAKDLAETAKTGITTSNEQMQNLMTAMNNISTKSVEISKIIKTIEDIAFQTNILALNAAVEAARAGAAGKGFAVVADEVRNLAGKSAQAAKSTTTLIEDSVASIGEGVQFAQSTAKELLGTVDSVQQTTTVISDIAVISKEQSASIKELVEGIDQISAVVQTNSATSEESAAASQELSSLANLLNELVRKFKIRT